MTRLPIIKSLEAERDLDDLFDYIAADSGVERAELVLRRIDGTLKNLADWPFIGRSHTELDGAPRVFSLWPWMIFYEPQLQGRGIIVWRVLDGRRDLSRIVRPPEK